MIAFTKIKNKKVVAFIATVAVTLIVLGLAINPIRSYTYVNNTKETVTTLEKKLNELSKSNNESKVLITEAEKAPLVDIDVFVAELKADKKQLEETAVLSAKLTESKSGNGNLNNEVEELNKQLLQLQKTNDEYTDFYRDFAVLVKKYEAAVEEIPSMSFTTSEKSKFASKQADLEALRTEFETLEYPDFAKDEEDLYIGAINAHIEFFAKATDIGARGYVELQAFLPKWPNVVSVAGSNQAYVDAYGKAYSAMQRPFLDEFFDGKKEMNAKVAEFEAKRVEKVTSINENEKNQIAEIANSLNQIKKRYY